MNRKTEKIYRLIRCATVRLVTSFGNFNNAAHLDAMRQLCISNCCMQCHNYRIDTSNGEDAHTQSRCHFINWLLLFSLMDFLPAKKAAYTWMHYKWSINKLDAHFDSGPLWCCAVWDLPFRFSHWPLVHAAFSSLEIDRNIWWCVKVARWASNLCNFYTASIYHLSSSYLICSI